MMAWPLKGLLGGSADDCRAPKAAHWRRSDAAGRADSSTKGGGEHGGRMTRCGDEAEVRWSCCQSRSRCRDGGGPTLFLPLVLAALSRTCHGNNLEPFRGQMFRHVLPGYAWLSGGTIAIDQGLWQCFLSNSPYGSQCHIIL
jgi:hypothetical protein